MPVPPHLLQLAALGTLVLHCAVVCSDPDPVEDKSLVSDDDEIEDPVEALLREERRVRAYALTSSGSSGSSANQLPGTRACELCGLMRGGELRGYHCSYCGRCIALRDHHCEWIGTCVGRNNTGTFISMLCVMLACLLGGCIDLSVGLWLLHAKDGVVASSAELSTTIAMGASLLAVGGAVGVYNGWLLLFILGLWADGTTW